MNFWHVFHQKSCIVKNKQTWNSGFLPYGIYIKKIFSIKKRAWLRIGNDIRKFVLRKTCSWVRYRQLIWCFMNSYFFSSFKDAPENLKFFYKSGLKSLDLPHGFESYESLSCSEKTKKKNMSLTRKKTRFLLNLGACCFIMGSCRILLIDCDSSVGRALDWRSKGPVFDPRLRQFFT